MTRLFPAILLMIAAILLGDGPAPVHATGLAGHAELQRMRAERRAASRALHADPAKSGTSGLFGLLVIPVDFADARLPDGWESTALSPRLTAPTGESLRQYFDVAAEGKVDLRITLGPLVRLAGTRRDYSDRDLQGFTRTRALATEALQAVRDLGLEFRRLDMDGPDLIPGTADDDGEIDGVLILHAAPGQENDPQDGLIQPLQFYLDDPVISDGIAATFYSVASMQSGPGIWAHETGHLLGLEDRYDPLLPVDGGHARSRGGLGRFSLMASGAWGTGEGWGAALPDAYSRLQMGWIPVRNLPPSSTGPDTLSPGEAARVWTRSEIGPEFFLLETRDPASAAPFDAAVPEGGLIIYHLDETIPEGNWSDDGFGEYHLRARVVEADDDRRLQDGLDDGRAEDLFPGPLDRTEFTPSSIPASDGYGGPTSVAVTSIASFGDGISFHATTAESPGLDLQYGFRSVNQGAGETEILLFLSARETGPPLEDLRATVTVVGSPTWGTFEENPFYVHYGFERVDGGTWQAMREPARWIAEPVVPAGAVTDFSVRFTGTGYDSGLISWSWVWGGDPGPLDFAAEWPGEWVVDHPDGETGTTWYRWDSAPYLTADESPVLACVASPFSSSAEWPAVSYGNNAWTTLTSGPLGGDVVAVRIIHALAAETLAPGEAVDGGRLVWVDPGGREVTAHPVDGYPARIEPRAANPLHGLGVFAENSLELADTMPLWRNDIFPVPPALGGPWRLRLVFASNPIWRREGWFVASLEALTDTSGAAFTTTWDGDLRWQWPYGTDEGEFVVESRGDARSEWMTLWSGTSMPDPATGLHALEGAIVLAGLPGTVRARHDVRVTGLMGRGLVSGVPTVVYPDGGDGQTVLLAQPWPNPGAAPIRFQIDVPVARAAKVSIFDVRGRLVRRLDYPVGSHLGVWDGRDSGGRRAPSGTYFLRLEGSGPVTTRKVVLLH